MGQLEHHSRYRFCSDFSLIPKRFQCQTSEVYIKVEDKDSPTPQEEESNATLDSLTKCTWHFYKLGPEPQEEKFKQDEIEETKTKASQEKNVKNPAYWTQRPLCLLKGLNKTRLLSLAGINKEKNTMAL